MPPRKELNERFKGYITKAQRTRRLFIGFLLVTCLVAVTGFALDQAPPEPVASLTRGIASVGENASNALALISNFRTPPTGNLLQRQEAVTHVPASPEVARLLEVARVAPLLKLDRVLYSITGSPIEWRVALCNLSGGYYVATMK